MFWENFWANFLSGALIIVLFGGGTYFLFCNKINKIINQKINRIGDNIGNTISKRIEQTIKQIKQINTQGDNINISQVIVSDARNSTTTKPDKDIIENTL